MKYAISILLVAMTSLVAHAQDDEARIHFEAGNLHYTEANYEAALSEFTRAFELSNRPALLFNMSQCHERLGQLPEAISTLERYIAGIEDEAEKEQQVRRLGNLQRRQADETAQSEAAREAAAAEAAAAEAAAESAAEAAADAQAARQSEEEQLAAEGRADQQATPPSSRGKRTAGFALLGVAGAGLVMTVVGGAMAASENSRLQDACDFEGTGPFTECTEDGVSSLRTRMLVADLGLGLAIAAGIAGVVLLILDGRSNSRDSAVLVGPDIRRDGGGASMQVSF